MFVLPQIIYDKLDMLYLAWSKSGYIKHLRCVWLLHIPPQQIISADKKEVRNSYQHID